eukprot:gene6981-7718_t
MSATVDDHNDDDSQYIMHVTIYDRDSCFTTVRVQDKLTTAKDLCADIASKLDLAKQDCTSFALVLVCEVPDSVRNTPIFCLRTLRQDERVLEVMNHFLLLLMERYQILDYIRLKSSMRWYYKDVLLTPLVLGDGTDVVGEVDSDDDDDELLTPSDLAYLTTKAECKGYLLRRSSRDQNLWRKWYCILTDHLWCFGLNSQSARSLCIKLSGVIRYKEGTITANQIQNIIINSTKRAHIFRVLDIDHQKKWIEELNWRTFFGADNESFKMAEVIITDEEKSRSQRFEKQLSCLLDIDSVYEECFTDYRQLRQEEIIFANTLQNTSTRHGESKRSPFKNSKKNGSSKILSVESSTLSSSSSLSSPKATGSKEQKLIHPLDRSRQQPCIHRLHEHAPHLAQIFQFIVDVADYKELFRHDLFVAPTRRRQKAVKVFAEYLWPQISSLQASENNSSTKKEEDVPEAVQSTAKPKPSATRPWGISLDTLKKVQMNLCIDDNELLRMRQAGSKSSKKAAPVVTSPKKLSASSSGKQSSNSPPGSGSIFSWSFSGLNTPLAATQQVSRQASSSRSSLTTSEKTPVEDANDNNLPAAPPMELFDDSIEELQIALASRNFVSCVI